MNNSRLIALALIAGSLAIVVLGWFLAISPTLDAAAASGAQRDSAAASNASLEARTAALKDQFENLSELEDELAPLAASIPSDGDLSGFLERINAVTANTGVSLDSLVVGAATLVTQGVAVDDPAATPDAAAPVEGETTETTPVEPAPVDPSTGIVNIPVTVVVSGSYPQILAFVGALQNDSRLFVIASVNIAGIPDGSPFKGSLAGSIFTIPATAPAP